MSVEELRALEKLIDELLAPLANRIAALEAKVREFELRELERLATAKSS
jgi:hypothetical protein